MHTCAHLLPPHKRALQPSETTNKRSGVRSWTWPNDTHERAKTALPLLKSFLNDGLPIDFVDRTQVPYQMPG
jgi:hypothetical protein